jgi:hypothetical protein
MSPEDLIGVIAPIVLSMIIAWFPSVPGDPINDQGHEMVKIWRNAGLTGQLAKDAEMESISFAKGATLFAGALSMVVSYILGAWTCLDDVDEPYAFWWTIGIIIWGIIAFSYVFFEMVTLKFYQLALTNLRRPFAKAGNATLKHTHFDAITLVLLLSALVIIAVAIAGYWSSLPEPTTVTTPV